MDNTFPSDHIFTDLGFTITKTGRTLRHYKKTIDGFPVQIHYQRIFKSQRSGGGYVKSSLRIRVTEPTIQTRFQVGPHVRALSKMKKVDLSHDPGYEDRVVMGLDPAWTEMVATNLTTRDLLLRLTRRHETSGSTGAILVDPGLVALFTDLDESFLTTDFVESYVDDLAALTDGIVGLPATYTAIGAKDSYSSRWIAIGIAAAAALVVVLCIGTLALVVLLQA